MRKPDDIGFRLFIKMLQNDAERIWRETVRECMEFSKTTGLGIRAAASPKTPLLCMWLVVLMVSVMTQGCATTYRPKVTGPGAFAFTPTPEQCAQLLKEKRTYRATEKTATYVGGATALLSVIFLGVLEEKAAPAASAGATLLASGVSVFAGSQVESLEEEIELGSCLNRPHPHLPTLADGGVRQ